MVTVTRIDRFARSTFDLFAILKQIVDTGGQFRSLAEPLADIATRTGRLMIDVLDGLASVDAISSAPAQERDGAAQRHAVSIWAAPRNSLTRRRRRHGVDARRAQR